MPLVINTNVAALNSQRQLINSGNEMREAMERLSSGLRVNSAADDAAGLAIANRMTSQIRGLNQAVRNANDGVSLIQTAEGALQETTNILQRMRELAIQASNGIYSDNDRSTLDAEVQQLKQEISRIAQTTQFNGQKILDGSLDGVHLQVGAEAGETISTSFKALDTGHLGGLNGTVVGSEMANGLTGISFTAGSIQINGQDLGTFSASAYSEMSFSDIQTHIEGRVSNMKVGIVTELQPENTNNIASANAFATQATLVYRTIDDAYVTVAIVNQNPEGAAEHINSLNGPLKAGLDQFGNLSIVGEDVVSIEISGASGFGFGPSGSTVNGRLTLDSTEGVEVTLNFATTAAVASAVYSSLGLMGHSGAGELTGFVSVAAGISISTDSFFINDVAIDPTTTASIQEVVAHINAQTAEHGVVATLVAVGDATSGTVMKLASKNGSEISIRYLDGAEANLATALGLAENNASKVGGIKISAVSIGSVDGAQASLDAIDTALEQINSMRADLGAVANRLESTMANLLNISEKTSASRSRIMDADFAAESANLSRSQVLQQASQAMLAQANALPQQVLQLLNG